MKQKHEFVWRNFARLLVIYAMPVFTELVFAQSYSIDWHTIDSGGGTSAGGGYSMSGTIGQPAVGTMAGGGYTLDGGFWRYWCSRREPRHNL